MTTADPVISSVEGAVARIRFNRPERLNALDMELVLAFGAAVDAALADAPSLPAATSPSSTRLPIGRKRRTR